MEAIETGVDELLQLTTDPVAFYEAAPDNIKRMLLQAVFEKIWIIDEQIVGVDLTRPFAEVLTVEAQLDLGKALTAGDEATVSYERRERLGWRSPELHLLRHYERPNGSLAIDKKRNLRREMAEGSNFINLVETVRRYSKQPHLWRTSKRLAMLLTSAAERSESNFPLPHVHKLSQRLSDETVAALLSDYRAGSSLGDLRRTYALGRGSVQQLLRQANVRKRRKSLSNAEVAVLIQRYEAGLTIREIAADQELPKTTVRDALVRAGVAMRSANRRKV